jgi:transcriptional regulator with XRE-family HTH domain
MNYEKIEHYRLSLGFTKKEVAENLGITPAGYYKMIREKTLTVKALEKLCILFETEPREFFSENIVEKKNLQEKKSFLKN